MTQAKQSPAAYEDSGSSGGSSGDFNIRQMIESVAPYRNGGVQEAEMLAEVTNGCSQSKIRKHRRMANQIKKEFKCFYCEKIYGSSAAAIMHMRKKHKEGTKQEIERKRGIRVNDILRNQIVTPMANYSQEQQAAGKGQMMGHL